MKDPYSVLGVARSATLEEIKTAFRTKQKQVHPDATSSSDDEASKELNEAYEVLSDPLRRSKINRRDKFAALIEAEPINEDVLWQIIYDTLKFVVTNQIVNCKDYFLSISVNNLTREDVNLNQIRMQLRECRNVQAKHQLFGLRLDLTDMSDLFTQAYYDRSEELRKLEAQYLVLEQDCKEKIHMYEVVSEILMTFSLKDLQSLGDGRGAALTG